MSFVQSVITNSCCAAKHCSDPDSFIFTYSMLRRSQRSQRNQTTRAFPTLNSCTSTEFILSGVVQGEILFSWPDVKVQTERAQLLDLTLPVCFFTDDSSLDLQSTLRWFTAESQEEVESSRKSMDASINVWILIINWCAKLMWLFKGLPAPKWN